MFLSYMLYNAYNNQEKTIGILPINLEKVKISKDLLLTIVVIEVLLLIWALYIAITCSSVDTRIFHILVALSCPFLYIFVQIFTCDKAFPKF